MFWLKHSITLAIDPDAPGAVAGDDTEPPTLWRVLAARHASLHRESDSLHKTIRFACTQPAHLLGIANTLALTAQCGFSRKPGVRSFSEHLLEGRYVEY
jgi:hypothetical protein